MRQFGRVLWEYKMWWLVPTLIMGGLFVSLLMLQEETGIAPFIYTLF